MKNLTFLLLIMSVTIHTAQTSDKVVQDFFTALSAKDAKTLDLLTLDNMQLHSLAVNKIINLSASSKEAFIQNIASIPGEVEIEERIFDISSIKTEYLAQFQVPYEFYVNGQLSHSGTNVLTLLQTVDGWRISYIADTRSK